MILSLCTHLFSLQSIQFLFPVCVSFSLPWFLSSFVTNYEHSSSLTSYKNEGGSLLWFFFWSRFFFFFEQKRPKPERLHQSHTGSRNFWSRFFVMMKWYNYDWLFFFMTFFCICFWAGQVKIEINTTISTPGNGHHYLFLGLLGLGIL